MPPAVRIEAKAWDDPRFAIMGHQLRIDRDTALIKLARVWAYQTDEELDAVEPAVVDIIIGIPGAADAAVRARLAELREDGKLRLKGTTDPGRTDWLSRERRTKQLGGRARAASGTRDDMGRFVSSTANPGHGTSAVNSAGTQLASQLESQPTLFASVSPAGPRQATRTPPEESSALALALAPAGSPFGRSDLPSGDHVVPGEVSAEGTGVEHKPRRRAASKLKPAPKPGEVAIAERVLERLSARTERMYGAQEHVDAVVSLLRKGYSEDDLRTVVWHQCNEWLTSEKMNRFCRPLTLFAQRNFADYLPEARAAWLKSEQADRPKNGANGHRGHE